MTPSLALPARRAVAALTVTALAALVALLAPVAEASTSAQAFLRVAHAVVGAPEVTATVNGQPLVDRVAYANGSEFRAVPAGRLRVEVRPAGAAATSAPLLTTDADVAAGGAATVVLSGTAEQPEAVVVTDDLSAPKEGTARVRLVHAAKDAPAVYARTKVGEKLYDGTTYRNASAYEQLPAGVYDIEMLQAGTENVLQTLRGVTVQPGTVNTLVGVGGTGREPLQILALKDAVGLAASPRGGVATGGGGTADNTSAHGGVLALVALGAVLGSTAATVRAARRG